MTDSFRYRSKVCRKPVVDGNPRFSIPCQREDFKTPGKKAFFASAGEQESRKPVNQAQLLMGLGFRNRNRAKMADFAVNLEASENMETGRWEVRLVAFRSAIKALFRGAKDDYPAGVGKEIGSRRNVLRKHREAMSAA